MLNKKFLERDAVLDTDEIITLIQEHEASDDLARLVKLEKYFNAQNTAILNRQLVNSQDNNRIATPYCRYITNTITGYFMGKDCVKYTFPEGFDEEGIRALFRYNDEPAVNNAVAENMSIYGYGVEQIYLDRKGKFRFASINPKNVIVLFEDNIDQDIHSVIKYNAYYLEDEDVTKYQVDYYTPTEVKSYIFIDSLLVPESEESIINPFGDVPFIYYENADAMGDFEPVIPLVDTYDKTISNICNLFDYFNDAYLVFAGGDFEPKYDPETGDLINPLDEMKAKRCFTLPEGATAEFLVKPNITKDTLDLCATMRDDIHKFSHCPDVSDEKFFGTSGIALRYKMTSLENLCSPKESRFRKGLYRRLEILCNFLSLKNREFDYEDVTIEFKRNFIEDLGDQFDTVLKLRDIISKESLLERLPGVNVEVELERLQEEKERNIEEMQNQFPDNEEQLNPEEEEEQ